MDVFQELLRMCEANIARDNADVAKGEIGIRVASFLLSCPELTSRMYDHHTLIIQQILAEVGTSPETTPRSAMKRILGLIDDDDYPMPINLTQEQLNDMRIAMVPYSFQVTLEAGKLGLISKPRLAQVCYDCLPAEHKVGTEPMKIAYIGILSTPMMAKLRQKCTEFTIQDLIRKHVMTNYTRSMDYFRVVPIQVFSDLSRTWSPYKTHIVVEVYSAEVLALIADLEKMIGQPLKQTLRMSFAVKLRSL